MGGVVAEFRCDECLRDGLPGSAMGKVHDGRCGICWRCLAKMGVTRGARMPRGTNRTPPKKRRRRRQPVR